jgi:hypothetical protein
MLHITGLGTDKSYRAPKRGGEQWKDVVKTSRENGTCRSKDCPSHPLVRERKKVSRTSNKKLSMVANLKRQMKKTAKRTGLLRNHF